MARKRPKHQGHRAPQSPENDNVSSPPPSRDCDFEPDDPPKVDPVTNPLTIAKPPHTLPRKTRFVEGGTGRGRKR
jgi:hypothetical protein